VVDRDVCLRAIYAAIRFHGDLQTEISRRDGAIRLPTIQKLFVIAMKPNLKKRNTPRPEVRAFL
jgi:hypothetical protein